MYQLALLLIVTIAVAERVSVGLDVFVDGDGWGYLGPALTLRATGEILHIHGRALLYPAFVWGMLTTFDSYAALVAVQTGFAFLGAGLLLASWHRTRSWVPLSRGARCWHQAVGLVLLAALLWSTDSILQEHSLRPEAVIPLFAGALCYGIVRLFELARHGESFGRFAVFAGGTIFVAGVLCLLVPKFAPCAVITTAITVVLAHPLGFGTRRLLLTLVAAWAAIVVFLWLPERHMAERDSIAQTFLPATLLLWHMETSAPVMRHDLATNRLSDDDRALVQSLLRCYEHERKRMRESPGIYASLGYNPDRLLYGTAGSSIQQRFPDVSEYRRFCLANFARGVLRSPLRYLAKVLFQLELPYLHASPWGTSAPIDLDRRKRESRVLLAEFEEKAFTRHGAAGRRRGRSDLDAPDRTKRFHVLWRPRIGGAYRAIITGLGRAYVYVLAATALLALLLWKFPGQLGIDADLRRGCLRMACLGAAITLLGTTPNLVSATVHSLEISRYYLMLRPFVVLSQTIAMFVIGCSLLRSSRHWMARTQDASSARQ